MLRRLTFITLAAASIVACSKKAPDRTCEGFAACNAACDGGNMGACARAANAVLAGNGVARDQAKGIAMLERACKADEPPACWGLSIRYLTGKGVPRDAKKSDSLLDRTVSAFEKECRSGEAQSCTSARYIRRTGRAGVRDEKKAVELEKRAIALSQQACAAGKVDSCDLLADIVDRLPDHGLNTRDGVALLDAACDGGSGTACWRRGSQVQYHLAASGKVDDAKAYYERSVTALDKRCAAGHAPSCMMLGARLDTEGKFLSKPTDPAEAYGRACDLGDSFACEYASGWYGKAWGSRAPDAAKAVSYDRKRFDVLVASCDRSPWQSCLLAADFLDGKRDGFAADPARAADLRKRGVDALEADCKNEDGEACNLLAFAYDIGPLRDPPKATAMFDRACKLINDEQACTQAKIRKQLGEDKR